VKILFLGILSELAQFKDYLDLAYENVKSLGGK